MIQELIFTSAPRGLQLGKSGFCTVASTHGMAENVARLLESLSGYRHLFPPGTPGAAANPVNYSHLISKVGGRELHIISRVADAGLDYSGRSNKIAHHIALDRNELPAGGPAAVLRAMPFETRWDREPDRLPPRKLGGGPVGPGVCQTWARVSGDAGWGGALAEAGAKKRPAVVIVSPGMPALELVLESLALLPENLQEEVTFSTFYTNLPGNVQCLWRFVMADSPEAAAAKRNPQNLVIDCTGKLGVCPSPAADEARQGRRYSPKAAIALPAAPAIQAAAPVEEQLLELDEDDINELPPTLPRGSGPPVPPPAPYRIAPERREQNVMEVTIPNRRREQPDRPDKLNIIGAVMLVLGLLMMLVGGVALYTTFGPRIAGFNSDLGLPASTDRGPIDQTAAEKTAAEKTAAEKTAAEKGDVEKGDVEKGDVEKGDVEKGDAEKGDVEKGDAGKADSEKPSTVKARKLILSLIAEPRGREDELMLISPTAIVVKKQYSIAEFNCPIDELISIIGEDSEEAIAIKLNNEEQKYFTWSEDKSELTAKLEIFGSDVFYSITQGEHEKAILTARFSKPPSDNFEFQGSIKVECGHAKLEHVIPVVPVPLFFEKLASTGDSGGDVIDPKAGAPKVSEVTFDPVLFEILNKDLLNERLLGFTLQHDSDKKSISFSFMERPDFPVVRFLMTPDPLPANVKLEWLFEANFSQAQRQWGLLSAAAGVNFDMKKLSRDWEKEKDIKKVFGDFRNLLRTVMTNADVRREQIDGMSDKDPNKAIAAESFDKLVKFVNEFKVFSEKGVDEKIADYFKELKFVFRCKGEKGAFFVVLSNKSGDGKHDRQVRTALGLDLYVEPMQGAELRGGLGIDVEEN